MGRILIDMDSVRNGLRAGDLEKDTYERVLCAECNEELKTENDPDEIGSVRVCPECGRKWKQIG